MPPPKSQNPKRAPRASKAPAKEPLWVWLQPKRPPTIRETQFQNYNWDDLRTYFGISLDDTEEIRLLIDDALITIPNLLDKAIQGAGIKAKQKWADTVSSHILRECSERIILFFTLDNRDETGYAMWRMALWRRLRIKRNHAKARARIHGKSKVPLEGKENEPCNSNDDELDFDGTKD